MNFIKKFYFQVCFFGEKANQVVSEEKYKQLRDMSVSYHAYASKIHRKRI